MAYQFPAFVLVRAKTPVIPIGLCTKRHTTPGYAPSTDLSRISDLSCTDVTKPIAGLTENETKLFCAGADEFAKVDTVKDDGLGPTMNFTSLPRLPRIPVERRAASPPSMNPQFKFLPRTIPRAPMSTPFLRKAKTVLSGVARLKKKPDGTPDGGVALAIHESWDLPGAAGCLLKQQDQL